MKKFKKQAENAHNRYGISLYDSVYSIFRHTKILNKYSEIKQLKTMRYYWIHVIKSKNNVAICRCVDSISKEDLQEYLKKTSIYKYECYEIPEEQGKGRNRYYIDCDTEEKAEEMKNISFWKAQWLQLKEELAISLFLFIVVGVPIIILLYIGFFQKLIMLLWLGGFVLACLFKSNS